jgi:hypothetical protein
VTYTIFYEVSAKLFDDANDIVFNKPDSNPLLSERKNRSLGLLQPKNARIFKINQTIPIIRRSGDIFSVLNHFRTVQIEVAETKEGLVTNGINSLGDVGFGGLDLMF